MGSPSWPSPPHSCQPSWLLSRLPVLWTPSPGRDPSQCSPPPMTPLPRSQRRPSTACWLTRMPSQLFSSVTLSLELLSRPATCPRAPTTVKTAGGEEIDVTRGRYITVKSSAGEAGVIAFDVLATNGVVHLVNSVF